MFFGESPRTGLAIQRTPLTRSTFANIAVIAHGLLTAIAQVISGEQDIATLDQYPEWTDTP